jgi:hypothetical protein
MTAERIRRKPYRKEARRRSAVCASTLHKRVGARRALLGRGYWQEKERQMRRDDNQQGVTAIIDETGCVWANCAKASQLETDYVIEGPLSGFVFEDGAFTPESEQAFRVWLADHMYDDGLFYVKDRETALEFAERIAEAGRRILQRRV